MINTPHFKSAPPLSTTVALALLLPFAYLLSLILCQNQYIPGFQILFFLLPACWVIRRFKIQKPTHKMQFALSLALTIGLTLIATFALNELLVYWLEIFPIPVDFEISFQAMFSKNKTYGLYIDLFAIALIPSICEEFFFRGFLQTAFNSHIGPKLSIFITALLFAFYHVNPWFFLFYFVLGGLFGWIYHKTKSTWFAILAHFLNNAYGILMVHFSNPF